MFTLIDVSAEVRDDISALIDVRSLEVRRVVSKDVTRVVRDVRFVFNVDILLLDVFILAVRFVFNVDILVLDVFTLAVRVFILAVRFVLRVVRLVLRVFMLVRFAVTLVQISERLLFIPSIKPVTIVF
jgi:hypothetical protein